MGQNKALLDFEGQPLVAQIAEVLRPLFANLVVVSKDDAIARACGLPMTFDIYENKGPLGGIHAALEYFLQPTFCVACDLPFLRGDVIEYLCTQLQNLDAVVPRIENHAEPLHAVYSPSCMATFESALQRERVAPFERVLAPLCVCFLDEGQLRRFDADLKFLTNLNTPDEARNAGFSL